MVIRFSVCSLLWHPGTRGLAEDGSIMTRGSNIVIPGVYWTNMAGAQMRYQSLLTGFHCRCSFRPSYLPSEAIGFCQIDRSITVSLSRPGMHIEILAPTPLKDV